MAKQVILRKVDRELVLRHAPSGLAMVRERDELVCFMAWDDLAKLVKRGWKQVTRRRRG